MSLYIATIHKTTLYKLLYNIGLLDGAQHPSLT